MLAGLYEFGREDGSIEPQFVRIALSKDGVPFPTCAPQNTLALARHALREAGFWWRRMDAPKMCPVDKDGNWMRPLPPAPAGGWA